MRSAFVFFVGVCALGVSSIGNGGVGDPAGGGLRSGSGEPPVITKIQWKWTERDCEAGKGTAVVVTVFVTDDDTKAESLTYSGIVPDCTPDISSDRTTLSCAPHHIGLRSVTVSVTDPQKNSDTVSFRFEPCEDGEVCKGGNPCP